MGSISHVAPFELESEREAFLNRVPKLGYHSSPRSWLIPPCNAWPLIAFMATAMAGSLILGVTVVSHTHPGRTLTKQEILGAAFDIEALALPGAAKRQEMQEGRMESMRGAADLSPTYQLLQGTDVIWQLPPRPTAVVLFAHGCGRHATDFWDHHPNCTKCRGMPEEVQLTQAALKRGYAVIAIQSASKCWNTHWPPAKSADISRTVDIVQNWRSANGVAELPLSAVGISSGGSFVTELAHALPLTSLAVYISSGLRQALHNTTAFPPTLFVHMPKDGGLSAKVTSSMATLRGNHVQTAELKLLELPLMPLFFHNRIRGVSKTVSEELYGTLKLEGFVDTNGLLRHDPRTSKWWKHFERHKFLTETPRQSWREDVQEELNVAYGLHEFSSAKVSETFDWFRNKCWYRGRYRHRRCRMFQDTVDATSS